MSCKTSVSVIDTPEISLTSGEAFSVSYPVLHQSITVIFKGRNLL
ncbi:hypothetical protein [Morganella morganii IS15]|nr:hypothetical protein [Morganella morganii IS15]